jgi:hypothetical protein
MIFPPRNPPFRHETERDAHGNDRIVIARRPEDEWFEHRDGIVTRFYIYEGEEKQLILLRRFDLLGRYPPEGAAYEWGFRVRLNGIGAKLPSRSSANEQALGDFFDAHRFKHSKCLLKYLVTLFDWIT